MMQLFFFFIPSIDCISCTVFKDISFNKDEIGEEPDFSSCPLELIDNFAHGFQINQLQILSKFFFTHIFAYTEYRLCVTFIANRWNEASFKNARYFHFGILAGT